MKTYFDIRKCFMIASICLLRAATFVHDAAAAANVAPQKAPAYIPGVLRVVLAATDLAGKTSGSTWLNTRRYMRQAFPQYPIVVGSYLNEEATPQLYVPVHIAADLNNSREATIRELYRLPAVASVESRYDSEQRITLAAPMIRSRIMELLKPFMDKVSIMENGQAMNNVSVLVEVPEGREDEASIVSVDVRYTYRPLFKGPL